MTDADTTRTQIQHALAATCAVVRIRPGIKPVIRGAGFWIADNVFATAYHILNGFFLTNNVHQTGDHYDLLQRIDFRGGVTCERLQDFELFEDSQRDLVLLKVRDSKKRVHLSLATTVHPGQDAALIGYPNAELRFAKRGVDVSKVLAGVKESAVTRVHRARFDSGKIRNDLSQIVHTSVVEIGTFANPGDCGGPCIDRQTGKVIGHCVATANHQTLCVDLRTLTAHAWLSDAERTHETETPMTGGFCSGIA